MDTSYKEVYGDLIALAKQGEFDVIAHGCNCFCTMGAGIAPQMASAFGCDTYNLELPNRRGDINKLGQIEYNVVPAAGTPLYVVNAYTQYGFGRNHLEGTDVPLDYNALTLCMKKINHNFKGLRVGLPQIGCGLAGGKWELVKEIIQRELKNCEVTVVIYKKD